MLLEHLAKYPKPQYGTMVPCHLFVIYKIAHASLGGDKGFLHDIMGHYLNYYKWNWVKRKM